ncbi:hypothetical protein PBRA_000686 [Plasmodiophora brassicae]|uniref:C3H1-type domain-containing protein n=1 Tax=Plasmodiophora brassicae TaxID=37360 RepID=A0A0G4IQ56_PLABS|nr:hypothetical protein PBRA_000686 [Plasmodiophora brassicae]
MSDDAAARLAVLRTAIHARKRTTSAVPCRFWVAGKCSRAAACPFAHTERRRAAAPHTAEERLEILRRLLNRKKGIAKVHNAKPAKVWLRNGVSFGKPMDAPKATRSKSFVVNGVRFRLSNCGRSLVRCDSPPRNVMTPAPFVPSRVLLNGLEFIKTTTGSLVRSSMQSSRYSASRVLRKSLQVLRRKKIDKRSKQPCMFYCRFGNCKDGDKCPYEHDRSKVAVCRDFIANGVCSSPDTCKLSHELDRNKMPVCTHFLKGVCTKGDSCVYRHVKVNPGAAVCQDFNRGYCAMGEKCRLKHVYNSAPAKPKSPTPAAPSLASPSSTAADNVLVISDTDNAVASEGASATLSIVPNLRLPSWV